jgi:hypothetical protein
MQNNNTAAVQKFPLGFDLTEVTTEPSNWDVKYGNQTGYKGFHTLSMNYCLYVSNFKHATA